MPGRLILRDTEHDRSLLGGWYLLPRREYIGRHAVRARELLPGRERGRESMSNRLFLRDPKHDRRLRVGHGLS